MTSNGSNIAGQLGSEGTPQIVRKPSGHPTTADLLKFPVFADLEEYQLEFLAARFSNELFEDGEVLVQAGAPATDMVAIFEGELQGRRLSSGGDTLFIAPAGMLTGKLPFSRMKDYPSTVRANGRSRVGRFPETEFPEMLRLIPVLGERLVGVLSDRVREVAKIDQSREKLAALGELSAGLAHELNNPASAAQRAASNLRDVLRKLADANRKIANCPMTDEQRDKLAQLESEAAEHMDSNPVLDTLARSDREEELNDWFERHHIANGWELSPVLADCGMDESCLDEMLELLGEKMLGSAVRRAVLTFTAERLLRDIDSSTDRIAKLVKAVKEYSYMDQMQEEDVDIHRGLETTLTVLDHSLKCGIKVIRQYDKKIPKLLANGGELNGIWTNLIQNAAQAMKGHGELRIRTAQEADMVLVEITDNGPGIPENFQNRIFEPFFTTKPMGEGTGLGLEYVRRIVMRHHGDVRFTTRPGETSFQVRLPITPPKEVQKNEPVYAQESNS